MRLSAKCLPALLGALLPLAAFAQTSDADYCKMLTQKYESYVANVTYGGSPIPGTVDGKIAVEQCKAGNTAAAIPVLEEKLRHARVDLPLHGAAVPPSAPPGHASDADYCTALSQKYESYIAPMAHGASPIPGTVDGKMAVEQCRSGNTAAAIPVLEQKLRNAKVDLPPRG